MYEFLIQANGSIVMESHEVIWISHQSENQNLISKRYTNFSLILSCNNHFKIQIFYDNKHICRLLKSNFQNPKPFLWGGFSPGIFSP